MFGHRFFGARYFGPRYWGPAVGAVIAPTVLVVPGRKPARYRPGRKIRDWEADPAWKNVEIDRIAAVVMAGPPTDDDAILELLAWDVL